MRRTALIVIAVVVIASGGALVLRQFIGKSGQIQRGDPVLATAIAIRFLERSAHPLTQEQVKAVLPLMRVLRDTDPGDAEASEAIAEQIRVVFTPQQRAELERSREEFRRRRQSGQGRQARGFDQGRRDGFNRAEFRKQILARVILQLESRL